MIPFTTQLFTAVTSPSDTFETFYNNRKFENVRYDKVFGKCLKLLLSSAST